jgi:rsbT antagonist protein RsbS
MTGISTDNGEIPILRLRDNLLVSIQRDLQDHSAQKLQEDVLTAIEEHEARGLIIDVSGLEIVDSYIAHVLVSTTKMAKLMGARTVVAGIRPEVAATLVRMGYTMDGIDTVLNVDSALDLLQRATRNSRHRGGDPV